jgi:hypothetical protein
LQDPDPKLDLKLLLIFFFAQTRYQGEASTRELRSRLAAREEETARLTAQLTALRNTTNIIPCWYTSVAEPEPSIDAISTAPASKLMFNISRFFKIQQTISSFNIFLFSIKQFQSLKIVKTYGNFCSF